jgi:predicted enzyme related to lactoylglutathione lyase
MLVPQLSFVILFVANPIKSAEFYSKLFGAKPIEQSPTFCMFALPGGVMLGLWSRHTAEPVVTGQPGSSEIMFNHDDVDALYNEWGMQGVTMVQKPTDMDFGRTFVALDLDGHRIRVAKMNGR